jgi:hypothetical protein
MQTRELIILLLLILLAAVVIAVVVRRGSAKRAKEHRAAARQEGTQAAWLESGDGPAEVVVAAADQPVEASADESAEASVDAVAAVEEPAGTSTQAAPAVPMTRAERREAREAAEGAQAEGAQAREVTRAESDPVAERIATAAGFRDEVAADDPLSEDIAIPANEWGGPRDESVDEEALDEEPVDEEPTVNEEPTVENPVEDDLPEEPAVEEQTVDEEPTVENPVEDDLPEEPTVEEQPVEEPVKDAGRRISGFLELRDGGFGVGSAAPIEDGAQPLDHPVQAYRDTMTFREPSDPGYDSAEPDVWFYDAGAAERSGFRPAEG